MNIAISCMEKDAKTLADARFGRCNYFAIYNTEDKTYRFVDNNAQCASGGAGIAAAQQMIDENIAVILTGNMGPNAYEVIADANIQVYRIGSASVKEAVALFQDKKLETINKAGPAHLGMGHRHQGGTNA